MCQPKISWWIPGERLIEERNEDARIEYFPVKFCHKCNNVWEKPLKHTRVYKVVYHKDFPTYGLIREECDECIKERKEKLYESRRKKCRKKCNNKSCR